MKNEIIGVYCHIYTQTNGHTQEQTKNDLLQAIMDFQRKIKERSIFVEIPCGSKETQIFLEKAGKITKEESITERKEDILDIKGSLSCNIPSLCEPALCEIGEYGFNICSISEILCPAEKEIYDNLTQKEKEDIKCYFFDSVQKEHDLIPYIVVIDGKEQTFLKKRTNAILVKIPKKS